MLFALYDFLAYCLLIASAGFPEEVRCFAPLFLKNRLFSL